MAMKLWRHWTRGWGVLARLFFFYFIVFVICIPVWVVAFFLDAADQPLFGEDGFHWPRAVVLLTGIIFLPIGLSVAQDHGVLRGGGRVEERFLDIAT